MEQPAEPVRSWESMRRWAAGLLEKRTGHDLAEWNRRVAAREPRDEAALRAWLSEQDVTGYAQWLLVRERFGYPEFLLAGADERVGQQAAFGPAQRAGGGPVEREDVGVECAHVRGSLRGGRGKNIGVRRW